MNASELAEKLTDEQRSAILKLHSSSVEETVASDVIRQLIDLEIVKKDASGMDFTKLGEEVYQIIIQRK